MYMLVVAMMLMVYVWFASSVIHKPSCGTTLWKMQSVYRMERVGEIE